MQLDPKNHIDWNGRGSIYPDMKNYDDMNAAYKSAIAKDFPARATVGVGLVNADGLVEIMMTAVK